MLQKYGLWKQQVISLCDFNNRYYIKKVFLLITVRGLSSSSAFRLLTSYIQLHNFWSVGGQKHTQVAPQASLQMFLAVSVIRAPIWSALVHCG